ncbi:MAG TPA: ABC transporter ATP-binding protein [Terriglobia bacterium]|nr:ABC transporter ATP-binding protein [Terriglobia bacterium]
MEKQSRKSARKFRIWSLLKPHSKALTLGLLAAIGESIAGLLEPWPLKIVLDNVLRSKPAHGWLNRWILSIAGTNATSVLKFAVAALAVIALLDALCSYQESYLMASVGQWVMHDLRRMLYSHIQRLSLAYYDQKQTGDLISRITGDIDAIRSFITTALLGSLIDVITLFGMLGVMLYLDWRFTLIALSVSPVLFAIVYSYTRRIKKASRQVRKKEGEITSIAQEVLSSMRVVKAFAREEYEENRFEEGNLESVEAGLRARTLKARLTPLVGIVVATGTCLVLWFGVQAVMKNSLSLGSLIIFILYLGKMYKPMQDLSKMTDTYSRAAVGYERIREVLETDPTIRDTRRARQAPRFKGKIEFEHVSFTYANGPPVLRDLDLQIEPGQVAALVGPTGAGKTTIISLVARFYDPVSGSVKIDGHDIRKFRLKSLRNQMSFVLQETLLFRATVWQNIAYGKPEARRAEILRAAEMANASEFIDKLPEGYNSLIGERGVTLSGGQRQRIAIARAIIRDTPILLLDEASSELDASSEELVFEALDRLMEGKTCIVIAHRLSTVRRADVIFVVEDGTIVERGKHRELLEADGLYAKLHKIQFHRDEAEKDDLMGRVVNKST